MTSTVISLPPRGCAIVGYGSLLSVASMERTLGRRYSGPFVPCTVGGWRRTWDVAMPNRRFYAESGGSRFYPANILYLNVRRDAGCRLTAVLFVIGPEDLERFDRREWIYSREEVTADLLDVRVDGGPAYLYVGRPEHLLAHVGSPREAAIRSTYVALVEEALDSATAEFRRAYAESSDPVPQHLMIDDREDAGG